MVKKLFILLVFVVVFVNFVAWGIYFKAKSEFKKTEFEGKMAPGFVTKVEAIESPFSEKYCYIEGFFVAPKLKDAYQFMDVGTGEFCDKMATASWKKMPVTVVYDLDKKMVFIKGNRGYIEVLKLSVIGVTVLSLLVLVSMTIPYCLFKRMKKWKEDEEDESLTDWLGKRNGSGQDEPEAKDEQNGRVTESDGQADETNGETKENAELADKTKNNGKEA